MSGLMQIVGYTVWDKEECHEIGPLLMDASGACFVLVIAHREAFPISDFPNGQIRRD